MKRPIFSPARFVFADVHPMRWLAIQVVVLAFGGLSAQGCDGDPAGPATPPPPPREIEVLTMAPSEVRDTGEYLGSLLARGNVVVLPRVAGYVRAVLVRPGQQVAVGAPLIEIDARDDSAALASAQAQLSATQASLSLSKQVRDRTEAMFREGLATAEELDQRRASVESAAATARAADAQVLQRRVALQYNSVRAAVAGVVGDVLVRVGDFVTSDTKLTAISQSGGLELSVSVPATRARGISVGTPVEVLDRDGVLQLASTVFFVSPDADPSTQLVEVKAAISASAQGPQGLRSSELVRSRMIYSTRMALQVPASAVLRQSGQAFVFVVLDSKDPSKPGLRVERRPVELGDLGDESFVLVKGLVAGERIAMSSIQQLRDGGAVKMKAAAPSSGKTAAAPEPAAAQPPAAAKTAAGAGR